MFFILSKVSIPSTAKKVIYGASIIVFVSILFFVALNSYYNNKCNAFCRAANSKYDLPFNIPTSFIYGSINNFLTPTQCCCYTVTKRGIQLPITETEFYWWR
eukprot:289000_1